MERLPSYRERLYASWTLQLVKELIRRNRVHMATVVLCSRIAFEDALGRLFAHALTLAWPIRESYEAYRTLERAAAAHPDTNLPLLFECVRRLR